MTAPARTARWVLFAVAYAWFAIAAIYGIYLDTHPTTAVEGGPTGRAADGWNVRLWLGYAGFVAVTLVPAALAVRGHRAWAAGLTLLLLVPLFFTFFFAGLFLWVPLGLILVAALLPAEPPRKVPRGKAEG